MAITKVMVVDDSVVDLTNLKDIISDAGYTVITATSGNEAILKAKQYKPDLIFLDVIMGEPDGFEVCRSMGKDNEIKNIPVVFVTSKNQKADRVWAELQGGKGLIGKPYTPAEIISQLQSFN
ncbi:MAG: response regulator [Gammaproteobacteria bacterium]|nr:response regulator [Gammaproteobacteria bacterium]